jgi:hypothetical protein
VADILTDLAAVWPAGVLVIHEVAAYDPLEFVVGFVAPAEVPRPKRVLWRFTAGVVRDDTVTAAEVVMEDAVMLLPVRVE